MVDARTPISIVCIQAKKSNELSPLLLLLLQDLVDDWRQLYGRIGHVTTQIETLAKQNENCKHLMGTPGIGPLVASAMVAAIGDGAAFIKGRDFAAWLGLVPQQISTGDRTIVGSISRRGNRYFAPCWSRAPGPLSSGQRAGQSTSAEQRLRSLA
jgi:transposase